MMIDRVLEPEVMDDEQEARAYAAMDHREPNAAFVDRLVQLMAGRELDVALDMGTGPGDIPILLCEKVAGLRVVAVDLAESMLAIARGMVAAAGQAERVDLQRADVKVLPFADDSFDVVFSNTILHHIPEPAAMLAEAGRVLRPGGVLLIRDLFRPQSDAELQTLVDRHASGIDAEQRRLFADSLRAALTPDELRELAKQQSIGNVEVVIDTDRHMSLQSR